MIRFFGRSKYIFKAPNKLIKIGYKIFSLCEAGYTYYFMWSSKLDSYGELEKQPDLSLTELIVFQLAGQLLSDILYVLCMDNLFTRVSLLRRLRKIGIGACGTTWRYSEFSAFLIKLKEHCARRMEWNITAAIIAWKKIKVKQENDDES